MEFAIPMTISLGTIISILITAGNVIYGTGAIALDGIGNLKSNRCRKLADRCTNIINDLQKIDKCYLITSRCHQLVQTVINCLKWSQKYDKKSKFKRIIFSDRYQLNFIECHEELTKHYNDMVSSLVLIKFFEHENLSESGGIN